MAFFGLTALGPQNCFAAGSKHITHLMIFNDKDYEDVWNKITGINNTYTLLNKIPDMLRLMYRGNIPHNDKCKIDEAFEKFQCSDTISYYDFIYTMQKLRSEAEENEKNPKSTIDFISSSDLQAAMRLIS